MDFKNLKDLDKKYIANTYNRYDISIEKSKDNKCKDVAGKEYIDFSAGIGVNSLGFLNESWVTAVKEQLDKLNHISNLYYTVPQTELAEKLCKRTGMKKVFFANSGAEANEGAIKTARKYSSDKYGNNRYEIITLKDSFHGRTIATLSATGQEVFHKHFGPFVDGFTYAEANNLASIKALVSEKTCGIMLECIQGEGGVIPLTKEFIEGVYSICEENDILLIIDEVQTGIGRTGKFLASEKYNIKPDIITLAKGLGGGLPIGAVLFGEKTQHTLGLSDHGTTFGGNPIVAAGAIAVVDAVDDKFLAEVMVKGEYLKEKLINLKGVRDISGEGLMLGITLEPNISNTDVINLAAKDGLILLSAKHKVRLLPPLTITYEELDMGIDIIKKSILSIMEEKQ